MDKFNLVVRAARELARAVQENKLTLMRLRWEPNNNQHFLTKKVLKTVLYIKNK